VVTIRDGPRGQSIIECDQKPASRHHIEWPCSPMRFPMTGSGKANSEVHRRVVAACCQASPVRPRSRTHDAYERATLHSVALWCVAFRRPPFGSVGRAPAPCDSGSSRNLCGYESASTWITLSFMDQNLCRRLMPRPKLGRSRPTAAAAAPATPCMVHLQIVGREQMAIAADIGYGHALGNTFRKKAHDISFGCSKARPRYHFNGLHRRAPDCLVGPRFAAHPLCSFKSRRVSASVHEGQ
jgi:hypothetical protein